MVMISYGHDGFPPSFSEEFYRKSNIDLVGMDDAALRKHYASRGREEGRLASPAALREGFIKVFGEYAPSLEIGPFDCPVLKGTQVSYFDVMTTADLRARAIRHGRHANDVPEKIHFVSPTGDLSIVDDRFSLVFSSHVIEHQPDLISHLQNVERLLTSDGIYALIVPDCCYCFDHFLGPSNVPAVVEAYEERRNLHTLSNVINHYAYTTHNDAVRHWKGNHGDFDRVFQKKRIKQAVEAWNETQSYIDVHAWQFTPKVFAYLIGSLADLGYFDLRPIRVYDTPRNRLEFCVVLARPQHQG